MIIIYTVIIYTINEINKKMTLYVNMGLLPNHLLSTCTFISVINVLLCFFYSILSISPIRFNDMNRRVALLVHLLLPEEHEVHLFH